MTERARSAYVHVPFCARRCGYCSFAVVAGRPDLVEPYLRAIEQELAWLGSPREVDTLYFGGGTPSQLGLDTLQRLLDLVLAWHPLAPGGEFTVEANPLDLDQAKLGLLAEHGVTRLSLGAQSFDDAKLVFLERDHRASHIHRAYDLARRHIGTVALDLIFAVPGESPATWAADLAQAVALGADHLSTYDLTIEKGARFYGPRRRGLLALPAEPLQRSMFILAMDHLTDAGYDHYEVSSFARPGRRCRHNEAYWLGATYYGVGPGAARYLDGRRELNHRSTTTYLRRILAGATAVVEREVLAQEDVAREVLVFALRRLEGVDRHWFSAKTGAALDQLLGPALAQFVQLGLLADDGRCVRLTRAGLLVSDSIWPHFLRR
ncbi:MAG: coproporphyrinogen III oxidase [Planctomycetes bacterium RBG_16_64_10]|nr:MAG: coproporphyrinogen III oxidase [Planctomycetes bacterium RBG_16_64_10]